MAVRSRETPALATSPSSGGRPRATAALTPRKSDPAPALEASMGTGASPVESWVGSGFISLSTIFWYKALRLNGSTVKGRVPVSMAYMFTPLRESRSESRVRPEGRTRRAGRGHLPVLSLPRTF